MSSESTPSTLNMFKCKCPRCRIGNMFAEPNPYKNIRFMKMKQECDVCKQPFDIEVGFYYGASYVSYAIAVALSVSTFVAWWVLVGFSLEDNSLIHWLIFNGLFLLVLQPYLMRFARTLWLWFFVRYNKNWRNEPPKPTERQIKEHQNSW